DPGRVAELVAERRAGTGAPRLAAILATDLYGHPADADALRAIAHGAGAAYIEDAAESLGAAYRGRAAGSVGDLAVLSFNGNKVITAGGGGAVATDDADAAQRVRHLSAQARSHPVEYHHDQVGFNYRLPSLNAALALAQLERLDELVEARRSHRAAYAERLPELEIMGAEPWAESSHWLTCALLPEPRSRDEIRGVVDRCGAAGVEVRPFFAPVHELAPYADAPRGPLPATEDLYARGLNLPSSADLRSEDIDRVCETLRAAL
ncbi:MAG: DegT/DnrJ/EryC1/StrS family aminotransferase, partial [Thermoleophilaceae bacterium]|nr:DegT/DnrJ/EryC1/StrS family aminotransferase [Thermoleophilaceae bacterium]